MYIPAVFRCFQGFSVRDIKEYRDRQHVLVILEKTEDRTHLCPRCDSVLGAQEGRYWVEARHLRMCGWTLSVGFWREKRHCAKCKKIRSEWIEFLCPTSPHMTMDLSWWINRLTEITSVLRVSVLEGIDKMTCYRVDKWILIRLLQGYQIPKVTQISVDEVYARGPKQLKEGENRDDLFLTVIVDLRTRKVIWVTQGRSKDSLDSFFEVLGEKACKDIQVVATDQHESYSASVREYCPNAKVVWDRFHLVQKFNEAINEERKLELQNIDPDGPMGDLANGKYRYVFLTKAVNRSDRDRRHIEEVSRLNSRISKLEIIKERFHQIFEAPDRLSAQVILAEVYEWAWQAKAFFLTKWILSIVEDERFWNYFDCRVTTGLSEGINRVIKGIKWQAYGYKDMQYFALKIMQKAGYLNYQFALSNIQ